MEIQITPTLRFHLTPIRMAMIKNKQKQERMQGKGNPYSLLISVQIGPTTL